ncbi:MAG: hypothetical protein H6807_01335 [Planctomycetes bacterium]|nr:hypothetical protein [Planctomycetota bacterium]
MKSLGLILLLPLTLFLLLVLILRRPARPLILRSPFLRQALRVAALLLVLAGFGRELEAQDEPGPASRPEAREAPVLPDQAALERFGDRLADTALRRSLTDLLESLTRVDRPAAAETTAWVAARCGSFPDVFARMVAADLAEPAPSTTISAAELREALAALDQDGLWFLGVDALLGRLLQRLDPATPIPERVALLTALERHRRLSEALVLAMARMKPLAINPRAWASKAGPGRELRMARALAIASLRQDLERILDERSRSTARDDAATSFRATGDGIELAAPGQPVRTLTRGKTFSFGRHDLIWSTTGGGIDQAWLGTIVIPAGAAIGVAELPALLDTDQRTKVEGALDRALAGDAVAQGLIELSLPLVHRALARRLDQATDEPGCDALRMILRLHDDLLPRLPARFEYERPEPPLEGPR